MGDQAQDINASYEQFYAKRAGARVYPTEFVVRTFLANYPGLLVMGETRSSCVIRA